MDVLGQTVRRNETRRKIWKIQKSCLSYLLLCNKLPQSQWLVTYTRLFARDSVDVLFGAEPREDCSSPPHMVSAKLTWARGSEVPHCHVWQPGWRQAAVSMFLPQACFPLQQVSSGFFLYMVAQKLSLLKVCNSQHHFCHILSHQASRDLGGTRDTTLQIAGTACTTGMGRPTGDCLCR